MISLSTIHRKHHKSNRNTVDQIDGIGGKRRNDRVQNNSDNERNNTLNQFMTEIDGFLDNQYVVVIAATNRI